MYVGTKDPVEIMNFYQGLIDSLSLKARKDQARKDVGITS